jgi:hypothetical protein
MESDAPHRGVVCRAAAGRPVQRFRFDCLESPRFWSRRDLLLDAAARTILGCATRPEDTPWAFHPDTSSRPPSLWKSALSCREWGLALREDGFCHSVLRQPGRVFADPFPLAHGDRNWILFEEQTRGAKGVLSAGVLDGAKLTGIVHDILPSATHRSWPNAFHHQGSIWMVPESGADEEVALWRCERFPDRWEKVRTLLRGRDWTDPVLHFQDGRWWLFVSPCGPEGGSHSDSLELYHAPDLLAGEFRPHPWNPVSIGVAGSRPAGRLQRRGNAWIRPAQDCSGHYGRGLVFHRIEELTPDRYVERSIGRLDAPPGAHGIHTWNALDDGRILVDLLWSRPRWRTGFPTSEAGVRPPSEGSMPCRDLWSPDGTTG